MDKTAPNQNQAFLYGIIGLLAGILLAILFARSAVNSNNMGMMGMMGMRQTQQMMDNRQESTQMMMEHEGMGMQDMVDTLRNRAGEEFDKSFIDLMIEHHQGAIDMANLAKTNAKHDEIKSLADDIIIAQTGEIEMMRDWMKFWGY